MKTQFLVMCTILAAATASSLPANAAGFTVAVGAAPFDGRWYGRHEGHLGWWKITHGHWRRWHRIDRHEFRR